MLNSIAQNILFDPFEPHAIIFGNNCAIIDTESTVPPTEDLIGCGLIDFAFFDEKFQDCITKQQLQSLQTGWLHAMKQITGKKQSIRTQ